MTVIRFNYARRYARRGWLVETSWFLVRIYPPTMPTWTFWRRK